MINIMHFYEAGKTRKTKILDLPFQNSFDDITGKNIMIAGGSSNLPTFALTGRKTGEYCAVFNGSQSIKTSSNLLISSMQLTVVFAIKTTQTATSIICELSNNITNNNSFGIVNNFPSSGNIEIRDRRVSVVQSVNATLGGSSWKHVVATIDRKLESNYLKIYIDNTLAIEGAVGNNLTYFANNFPFFIGQRAGSSLGFVGSLMRFKMFNYVLNSIERTADYNDFL